MNPGRSVCCGRSAGFTLSELLVAFLAAAVMLLVVGALLMAGFRGLANTRRAVDLQRDMRAAMATLAQMTHSATSMSFSTSGVYIARYSNLPPKSVYISSTSNLLYDRDTTAAGADQRLANGTLKFFNAPVATNVANVVLVLGNSQETISNRVVLYRRN